MIKKANEIEDNITLKRNTNRGDEGKLLKRARAKYVTLGLMFRLVELRSDLNKSYWNTYHCAEILNQEGQKITSRYCKNRWCLVCNRIRTAVNILKYSDEINSWGDDRYFVTLTIPNVAASILSKTIDDMLKCLVNVKNVFDRKKIKFVGVRKLEVTYNPVRDDYHPHFHFIVKGIEQAELLQQEWLKRYPEAKEYCQDIRQGTQNESMELFKYFTKLISSQANKKISDAPIEYRRKIYVEALNNIFLAVQGRRTFQNFGFKGKLVDEIKEETVEVTEICDKIQYWQWEKELSDWINRGTGEFLTGYTPSAEFQKIVEGIETTL